MGQMLKEYLSPTGGKPPHHLKEVESDGAAGEPTNISAIQVPTEPQGQSQ